MPSPENTKPRNKNLTKLCYILMENLTSPPRQLLQVKDAVGPLFMIYTAVCFFPPVLVSDYNAN